MTLTLHSVADTLLGLLFPDRCASCGRGGSLFCAACRAQLRAYPPGSPTVIHAADQAFPLDGAAVAFIFEGSLRDAMHCFKYKAIRRMAQPLAELLNAYLDQYPLPADAIIPVPLHRKRLRERGFNQSELLAHRLSRQSGLPVLTEGLVRGRHTQQQAHLDMQGRQENVRDAFVWRGKTAPPDRVLILDDVLTTGATIGACAQTLRAAGSREVRALALGRSRPE